MTITRPHHPFQGQSLEVLRHARMRGRLHFVLILPDGSKSLIPAEWTDFNVTTCSPQNSELIGSLDDLLRLRGLVDALQRRGVDVSVTSARDQEGHAATTSELHRHPHSGDVPMGATRPPAKTNRRRNSGAPPFQGDADRKAPGGNS